MFSAQLRVNRNRSTVAVYLML